MPDENLKKHEDEPARGRRGNDERNDRFPYGGERDPAAVDSGAGARADEERAPEAEHPLGSSYGDRDSSARDANGDDTGSGGWMQTGSSSSDGEPAREHDDEGTLNESDSSRDPKRRAESQRGRGGRSTTGTSA